MDTISIYLDNFIIAKSKKNLNKIDKYDENKVRLKKTIVDIKKVGKEEAQCIYIDSDSHLYITKDFIVTHNTTQMAKMPNPIFLTVENGLNGIANVGALPVRTWNDMLKYNRKFGDKKFKALLDKGTEITLIIDGAEGLGMLCRDFICSAEKVNKIKEGNGITKWNDTMYQKTIEI